MYFTLVTAFALTCRVIEASRLAEGPILFLHEPSEANFVSASQPQSNQARAVIDTLMGKRQNCGSGFGYCSNFGRCCPIADRCCSYGYCLEPDTTCCPNGPCPSGSTCCGNNHCRPNSAECCLDETYCEAGNHCYKVTGYDRAVCCTDPKCTAYVTGGSTSTRTTIQPTPTVIVTQYYYFIVTWTYYVYYWYYVIEIRASVVTSSITTASSSYSIRATDSAAASLSFNQISATLSHYTPAEATSLKSLAGSTSFDSDTKGAGTTPPTSSTTPTSRSSTSTGASSVGAIGSATSPRASSAGSTGPTGPTGLNGATRTVAVGNSLLLWYGILGGAIGVLMIIL